MDTGATLLVLAAIGATSGLLGGMLGIGGGVIIVPALIAFFDATGLIDAGEITVVAVATSMACIGFTSLSAAYAQFVAGKVLWPAFFRMVPFFVAGSFAAGLVAPSLPGDALRAAIGVFLLAVGLVMVLNWKPAPHRSLPGIAGSGAVGLGGGFVAGIAGIAGGNVIVPTLIYFNTPAHNATATSSAMGVPIAFAGASGYLLGTATTSASLAGFVHLPSWGVITLAAILFAPLGVRLAHAVPAQQLKQLFGGFLFLVAARMLATAVT